MNDSEKQPQVANKLEDLKWFEAVARNSEQVLSGLPEREKSSWYKRYDTASSNAQ